MNNLPAPPSGAATIGVERADNVRAWLSPHAATDHIGQYVVVRRVAGRITHVWTQRPGTWAAAQVRALQVLRTWSAKLAPPAEHPADVLYHQPDGALQLRDWSEIPSAGRLRGTAIPTDYGLYQVVMPDGRTALATNALTAGALMRQFARGGAR